MAGIVTQGFNPGKSANLYKSAVGTSGIIFSARMKNPPGMLLNDDSLDSPLFQDLKGEPQSNTISIPGLRKT